MMDDFLPPRRLMSFGADYPLLQMHPALPFSKLLPSESVSRDMTRHRAERINVDSDYLSYPQDEIMRGMYIAGQPLTPEHNYFEIEILDKGVESTICLGVCPRDQSMDVQPGTTADGVAFYIESGSILRNSKGIECIEGCELGDHIGCGVKFDQMVPGSKVPVFFTRNGKEIGSVKARVPYKGFFPMVSMSSCGEEVRIMTQMHYIQDEDVMMSVDSCEDEWYRLSDIKLNGPVLEYKGKGKSIIDVGLAQAKQALNTTNHYFEIEIIDPGESCYIAIGLTNREFPRYRHPGWNKGSIGYHADDGKIFIGSGVGEPFGPRCHKGDRMGCGIHFPRDFEPQDCEQGAEDVEEDEEDDDGHGMRRLRASKIGNSPESPPGEANLIGIEDGSESEEDDEWEYEDGKSSAPYVEVFFTRNSKLIGKKRVLIPKGGFYPTVGMLSIDEKVRVDLHPMTG
ncbi:SPRY domain-containing protein 3-like isoform X2 [Neocloeon triangulifer]|uniref:SPRY domain-containing protein 3-like isoform X2 n=1 Tax=Neocloeon triangulifer TaxID=2078957 RepID=UPI00286F92E0|nr:SPRY domain-containing protein 3-like isoform X2 [Neocloeon triangulifer]